MIHFYTYYSVGGYKDMYLGNSQQVDKQTFYLPLLEIHREELKTKNDADLIATIEHQDALPQIGILSNDNMFGLPKQCLKITTQGNYTMVFTHVEGEKHLIVLRGLSNDTRDDAGRPIPFVLYFLNDSSSDISYMKRLAGYLAKCNESARKELAEMLHYDATENGLCCELKKIQQWIEKVVLDYKNEYITLPNGKNVYIPALPQKINLFITFDDNPKNATLTLGNGLDSSLAYHFDQVVPEDNQERATRIIEKWNEEQARKRRNIIVAGAVIIAFLLILMIVKCHQ